MIPSRTDLRTRLRAFKQWLRLHWYRYAPISNLLAVAPGISREARSVRSGIATHLRRTADGTELFELRRRIHMLEKGLTMQPRRNTFAVDYIEMTVRRLKRAWHASLLDDEMTAWARDVLNEYFRATAASDSPQIQRSKENYESFELVSESPYVGPAPVGTIATSISADELSALATQRRSVRWFQSKRVDREIVDRAIATAIEAPTACNRVPYRFEIFDDPDDAAEVSRLAGGTGGYAHNLQGLIVIIGDHSAFLHTRDRHLVYIDASLAAMSLVLSFESAGVSTCCINWPDLPKPERNMRDLLQLEAWERPVMLLAYGYADPQGLAPTSPKRSLTAVRSYRRLSSA